ncbi:MAG: UvrD-helicase domain-containing protein [Patescibacteria group bacterium]|jgi:DNA helicase-2/ATP-dependent DNA helicase PcrA
MPDNFLNDLNPEQQSAVQHVKGPSVILAGAGSGKTRVLTYKAMYLLKTAQVNPMNILMLTFTNKAADEMKKRIRTQIDSYLRPELITAQTFHSFCAYLLRKQGLYETRSRDFAIFDDQDQHDLAKDIIKEGLIQTHLKPAALLNEVSRAKNILLTPADLMDQATDFFKEQTAHFYVAYQEKLKELNAVDFDDLLLETVKLLREDEAVRAHYHNRFEFILVDEYQDTNHSQYMLTKLLAEKDRNITIVGDFSQSIYSWRGADFHNLEKFQSDFPESVTFNLERNYRSTQPILDVAFSVISQNTSHPILKLWTVRKKGEEVEVVKLSSAEDEAAFVLNKIQTLHNDDQPFANVAILYRTNAQSRMLEEVCLHKGIPYKIFGGVRFYERKEVKDVLAFIRCIVNKKDTLSQNRILKLGKRRGQKILSILAEQSAEQKPGPLIQKILLAVPYLDIFDDHDPEDAARLENIRELESVAFNFETLAEFLDTVALIETGYDFKDESVDKITMMTLHAAKGLEFDTVFIVGLEEGILPHTRSASNVEELEEERRLFYVGITRARRKLFITYAEQRMIYGRTQYNIPSQFLTESGLVEF